MDDDHMRAVQTHLDRGTQTASDALDALLDESVAWLAVFCARSVKDVTRPRLRTILDVNAIFAPSRPQDAAVEVASKRRRTKRALYVEHTKAVAAQGPTTRAMLASRLTDPSSVTIDVLAKDDIKVDPSTLKVVELKAALKKRGLRVGGLKIVLVQRLQAALDLEQAATCQDPLLDQTPPLTTDFPLAIASTGIMLPEDATSPRQPNVAARSTIDVLAASQVQSMDAVPTTSRQQLERDAPSLSPIAVCTSTAASSFDLDEPLGFASENPFASPVAAQASLHSWPPRPHFGIPRDQQPAVVCAEAFEPVRKSATSLVYSASLPRRPTQLGKKLRRHASHIPKPAPTASAAPPQSCLALRGVVQGERTKNAPTKCNDVDGAMRRGKKPFLASPAIKRSAPASSMITRRPSKTQTVY